MFKEIKTAEDLAQEALDAENAQKVSEAKAYLASTDWIVTKIAELQLEGVDVEPLKVKYAAELAERKLMREVV